MRDNDNWIIKINYLDEREWVVKREIYTKVVITSMASKANDTQILPVFWESYIAFIDISIYIKRISLLLKLSWLKCLANKKNLWLQVITLAKCLSIYVDMWM